MGSAWGEVHMQTLDGAAYDFQAAGEFIAARSDDGSFEIQLRTEPWKDTDNISITTAVAARVNGSRVSITYGAEPEVQIDGVPVSLQAIKSVNLPGGGMVTYRGSTYTIKWPDGSSAEARKRKEYFNTRVATSAALSGRISGLLGNANGDPADDFVTRGGHMLNAPLSFDVLYPIFANSWRVTEEESLFDYKQGESNETFNLMDFPSRGASTEALPKADRARAEKTCLKLNITEAIAFEACTVDVGFTRSDDFAEGALMTQQLNQAAGIVPRLLSDLTGSPQASIRAPAEVEAFNVFQFSWRGPGGDHDLIDLIPAGLSEEEKTERGVNLAITHAQT